MESGGTNGGNSPAPFLVKTYEMVDDSLTNPIVSWSHNGHSFVVWNPPEFARDLLPKYFKHNNFSSFIRQLNTYGFRKVDPEQWEFANEEFIRGHRHLLKNIHRRKPIHSHSGPGNASQVTDSERDEYEKQIEKLKQEKASLQSDLEKHKQENQEYEYELRSLKQTLQNIDERQRKLMSTLGHLLQSPDRNMVEHSSESGNKKRRLLALHYLHHEANHLTLQEDSNTTPSSFPLVNTEIVDKLDSSLTFWETFVDGINQSRTDDLRATSSGDSDLNGCHLSRGSHCSHEMDSPAMSSVCVDLDSGPKTPGIDVNMSPTRINPDIQMSNTSTVIPSAQAPGNDVFWQQFLSEAPPPSYVMTQEAQSQRR